jgi:hypothetical protein
MNFRLNIFLYLFVLLLVSCVASKPKVDNTPLISTTPTPTAAPDLSEALPVSSTTKSFSSLPKNELIDGFYYYDDRPADAAVVEAAPINKLRIRVAVQGDKACYLGTGLRGTDFEIESLVREQDGVWKGTNSNRYFTMPTLTSMVVYATDTDKNAEYVNKSIKTSDIRDAIAQYAARSIKTDNIVRLTLPRNVKAVYRDICLKFQPIYFRGKLVKNENQSDIAKIEASLDGVPTVVPPVESTPTPTPTPTPTQTSTPIIRPKTLRP